MRLHFFGKKIPFFGEKKLVFYGVWGFYTRLKLNLGIKYKNNILGSWNFRAEWETRGTKREETQGDWWMMRKHDWIKETNIGRGALVHCFTLNSEYEEIFIRERYYRMSRAKRDLNLLRVRCRLWTLEKQRKWILREGKYNTLFGWFFYVLFHNIL